ncbi:MAG: hypothetical protein ABIR87_00075 [Sphingomicrobium sp.]
MKPIDPKTAIDIVPAPTPTGSDPDPTEESDLDIVSRRDGWTPFCRRLFLQVLAETGRVTRGCEYAQLSKQSAYALRARDPLFAAGWEAACALARGPLADALYEQSVDGVTETITRDGVVVATRHHHDSRLSIAVLNRLDKRCDRAAEQHSPHLAVMGQWDHWLDLIGTGDVAAAARLLDSAGVAPARDSQLGQLPLAGNPTTADHGKAAGGPYLDDYYWKELEGNWVTSCPPPDGFDGVEQGSWGDDNYFRDCAPAELDLLLGMEAMDAAAERNAAISTRDRLLAGLAAKLAALDDPPATD